MSSEPEFFKSVETGVRLILTHPGLVPDVSGDLSLYTPGVGKQRPLMNPEVIPLRGIGDNDGDTLYKGYSWRFFYQDPATNQRVKISRSSEYSIKVDGAELKKLVLSPETLLHDTNYMATCQFVLFNGWVDELKRFITVVTDIDAREVVATIGNPLLDIRNRSAAALDRQRSVMGSVNYLFPSIGSLYLPSPRAIGDDSDRGPRLDDRVVTAIPVDESALEHLLNPPLTWDKI